MKYREYNQSQGMALPPYLDELIAPDHLVRVINEVIDKVDISLLSSSFKSSKHNKGGNLPYHPGMMLKILTYAYATGTYTCREIARKVRENIHFMWLAAMQRPDFRTINRYRSVYFQPVLAEIFSHLVCELHARNIVNLETIFLDGTKIASNSNKHKVVWRKNVSRYKANISQRTKELLKRIDDLNEEEMKRYGNLDLPELGEESEVTQENIQEISDKINESLKVDGKSSKYKTGQELRRISRQMKSDSKKMENYNRQELTLDGRNSYSKTDPDAGVMRMKNDEVLPGYNVQAATSNGFIVNADVYQNANDGSTLRKFLESMTSRGIALPSNLVADAGYGHEEVYYYLNSKNIKAYVKYPAFRKEKSNLQCDKYHYSKFHYHIDKDIFTCPEGKKLYYEFTSEEIRETGYVVERRNYRCSECHLCPFRHECNKSSKGRTLSVSFKLRDYHHKVRSDLNSPEGRLLYKQRAFSIETVFGEWKHNRNFRRFNLRGLLKVRAEVLLLSLAYNLRKLSARLPHFQSYLSDIMTYLDQRSTKNKLFCQFKTKIPNYYFNF